MHIINLSQVVEHTSELNNLISRLGGGHTIEVRIVSNTRGDIECEVQRVGNMFSASRSGGKTWSDVSLAKAMLDCFDNR